MLRRVQSKVAINSVRSQQSVENSKFLEQEDPDYLRKKKREDKLLKKEPNSVLVYIEKLTKFAARATFFQYAGAELKYNEKRQPPKKGIRKLEKYMKQLILGFIAFILFTEIVVTNFEKLNTVKSHSIGMNKLQSYTYTMNDRNIPLHYFERFNKNDILQRIDCETRDDEPIHCKKIKCMMEESFHERYHCLNETYPDGIPGISTPPSTDDNQPVGPNLDRGL